MTGSAAPPSRIWSVYSRRPWWSMYPSCLPRVRFPKRHQEPNSGFARPAALFANRTAVSACQYAGMDSRDRDPSGRARNTRPRDGLGRPLPHGARGVERVAEDVVLSPDDAVGQAQRLIDDGYPFHAHEVFEAVWKATSGEHRELWQGLAQLAVGLTHMQRGNAKGAVALLRRGADRID